MPMTTAQGTAAIDTALEEEFVDFAKLRANQTQLSQDDTFSVNVALVAAVKARLLADLDAAWSD